MKWLSINDCAERLAVAPGYLTKLLDRHRVETRVDEAGETLCPFETLLALRGDEGARHRRSPKDEGAADRLLGLFGCHQPKPSESKRLSLPGGVERSRRRQPPVDERTRLLRLDRAGFVEETISPSATKREALLPASERKVSKTASVDLAGQDRSDEPERRIIVMKRLENWGRVVRCGLILHSCGSAEGRHRPQRSLDDRIKRCLDVEDAWLVESAWVRLRNRSDKLILHMTYIEQRPVDQLVKVFRRKHGVRIRRPVTNDRLLASAIDAIGQSLADRSGRQDPP